jgi:subtilisin family serine protease
MKKLLYLLLLMAGVVVHAQKTATIAYYYQGNKISFPVNNNRLVIQLRAGENLQVRRSQVATLLQVPDTAVKTMATRQLISARLPDGITAEQARNVQAALAKQPYLDFVHPCFTSAYGKDMGYADQLVVKLKSTTSEAMLLQLIKKTRSSLVKKYAFAQHIYLLSAGAANRYDALALANLFFETGLFVYAQPDCSLFDGLFTDPNDPLYAYQWGHNNTASPLQYNGVAGTDMKLQLAWAVSTGAGIKVAVLDEGVDTGHADLKANLLQGFDCVSGTSNPGDGRPLSPARAHGTACTGIIAAVANNGIGVAGVAPDCKIIPINLSAANGSFTSELNIAAGFDYAWQNGADIISNSWGGGSPSDVLDDAIHRALTMGRGGKGSVVLFASGNNNAALSYPAVIPGVISVGGVNMCGKRKSPASAACDGEGWGASYGVGLDVTAPCVKIATTDISGAAGYNTAAGTGGDYFMRFNGTSSATPNTTGVVALILGANSSLTVSQARNVLESTCDKLPAYGYTMVAGQPNGSWNPETGHGLVNAFNAVQTALSGVYCNVQVQANGATRLCPGGSVTISVINPVAGTGYQWRKDGIALAAGTTVTAGTAGMYDVVATASNGCVAVAAPVTISILNNTPALQAFAGTDTLICAGEAVVLGGISPAVGGAPWLAEKRAFGMDWQGNSFVKFSLSNPLILDTIAQNMVSAADYTANKFFAGGDFTPYGYYAITQISNKLVKVDTANGVQQLMGIAAAPAGFIWSGLAWDPAGRRLYALASAAASSRLCLIDPATAAVKQVLPVNIGLTEWLAISNNGTLYTMSDNNYVYRINKITGAATALPSPVGADVIYQQDADFDPLTDSLYLTTIIQYQNFVGDLRTLNTNTGVSSVIGTLGGLSEIDATAIAGPGYRYSWSPAAGLDDASISVPVARPASTTLYTLSVTDMCGNTASAQVTVQVSEPPAAVIAATKDSICVSETVQLKTAANNKYVYQWYLNGIAITGATDSIFSAVAGGSYTVHIVNGACDSISAPFLVKTCSLLLNDNAPASLCATYFYDSGGDAGNYGNGESFTKTFTSATAGNLPRLQLTSFATEPGNDVFTVYDGPDISSPVLASLSGSPAMPLRFTGTSGTLTIRFSSNGNTTAAGWAGSIVCYQPAVYRSRATGRAIDAVSWEVKSGSGFIPAVAAPHWWDDSITIQPGHTVTIDTAMQLDQLWIKSGGTLTVASSLQLHDGTGTDIQSDGILAVAAAGNIQGRGDITLRGTLDNSASANSDVLVPVYIAGTNPQTVFAGGKFNYLHISNPAVVFSLANNTSADSMVVDNGTGAVIFIGNQASSLFTIHKKLALKSGRLVMDSNSILNLADSLLLQGGNTNSFVQGLVRRHTSAGGTSALAFPLGDSTYHPLQLNLTHSLAGPSVYQAAVVNAAPANRSLPPTLNAVSNRRYYTIENMGSQPLTSASLLIDYDSTDAVTDAASLRIAASNGNGGWLDIGGTGDVNEKGHIQSVADFTSFGNFVLANATGGGNAFAVQWLRAAAVARAKQVYLTWTIGNEINISSYTIERSANGIVFTGIAQVSAAALPAAEKNYAAWDRLPEKGLNYYRIKQIAKDGRISYSKILQVTITDPLDFIIWPNPASTTVHVQNRQVIERLQCYNANGQLVYEIRPAAIQCNIPVQSWAGGVYHIKVAAGGQVTEARFIRQ